MGFLSLIDLPATCPQDNPLNGINASCRGPELPHVVSSQLNNLGIKSHTIKSLAEIKEACLICALKASHSAPTANRYDLDHEHIAVFGWWFFSFLYGGGFRHA